MLYESVPTPLLALERDGAFYDVVELGNALLPHLPWGPWIAAMDFERRVFSLGAAGLAELDEGLRAGRRPSAARLAPEGLVLLPPLDTDRALYVQVASNEGAEPVCEVGDARALAGHGAPVVGERTPSFPHLDLCVGAVLGDDLHLATPEEASAAILGYAVLVAWRSPQKEPWRAPIAAHFGPTLVTRDEVHDPSSLRFELRIGDDVVRGASASPPFTGAESIAYASQRRRLRAGDLLGLRPLWTSENKPLLLGYGAPIEVGVESLGRLRCVVLEAPTIPSWRSDRIKMSR